MVEWLATRARRLDEEGKLLFELLLTDEVDQPRWAERAIELFFADAHRGELDALLLCRDRRAAGLAGRGRVGLQAASPLAARRSAAAINSSGS